MDMVGIHELTDKELVEEYNATSKTHSQLAMRRFDIDVQMKQAAKKLLVITEHAIKRNIQL